MWKYEEKLSRAEVELLTGRKISKSKKNSIEISLNSFKVDKLKKLTFTHFFHANKYYFSDVQ